MGVVGMWSVRVVIVALAQGMDHQSLKGGEKEVWCEVIDLLGRRVHLLFLRYVCIESGQRMGLG